MKTTEEIDQEIDDLKKQLQQLRLISLFDINEQAKCDSESSLVKCDRCDCYKNKTEIYDVLESKKRAII